MMTGFGGEWSECSLANTAVDVQRLFEGAKEYADLSGRPQPVLADLHAAHQEAASGSGSNKRLRRESKRRRNRTWRREPSSIITSSLHAFIPSCLHPILPSCLALLCPALLRTGPHWSALVRTGPQHPHRTSQITHAVIVPSYTPRKGRTAAIAPSRDHPGSPPRSLDHPGGYKAGQLEFWTNADSDSDSESSRGSTALRAGMGSWSTWKMDLCVLGSCERPLHASEQTLWRKV
jgi:hypothetical protein